MPKKLDAMKLNLSRPGTLSPHHGEGRGVSGITKPSKLKYEISSSYLFKYDIVPPNISHTETSKNVSPLTLSLISPIFQGDTNRTLPKFTFSFYSSNLPNTTGRKL